MTHNELVKLAERWLRRKHRIVLSDVRCTLIQEQPDAIGWTLSGYSTVIECKASVSDFRRDASKTFRRRPEDGMGFYRYYLAPKGLLKGAMPSGWGLLEADPSGRIFLTTKPGKHLDRNTAYEQRLVLSALSRVIEGWGRNMFGDVAPPLVDGDPHPSAAKIIRLLRAENQKLKTEVKKLRK